MQAIQTPPPRKLHPIMWAAAISVIVFSLVGIGAVTGLIPTSNSQPAPERMAALPAPAPTVTAGPTAAEKAPVDVPAAAPKAIVEYEEPMAPPAAKPAPVKHAAPKPAKPAPVRASKPEPVLAANAPSDERAPSSADESTAPPPAPAVCDHCGVVSTVRSIEQKGDGTGVGAVGGAVAGGVLGHQMGGGRGRDVMTVIGAIAGGLGGHEIEKNVRKVVKHEVTVRFDDGSSRTFTYDKTPMFRSGDHVRLSQGELVIDNR